VSKQNSTLANVDRPTRRSHSNRLELVFNATIITILVMTSFTINSNSLARGLPSNASDYGPAEDHANQEFPMSCSHNVTFEIVITDGPMGSGITAPVTIFLAPDLYDENEINLGMYLGPLNIHNAPAAYEIKGLGFDELREYPIIYQNSTPHYDYWTNGSPQWISFRPYAAWTEKGGLGLAVPLSPDEWDDLTLAGDVVEFENLTIYLENEQPVKCGPDIIRIGANFTPAPEVWNSSCMVEIEGGEAEVDGMQIHINLGGAIPPSPLRCILYSGVAGGIIAALVVLWHRGKQQ